MSESPLAHTQRYTDALGWVTELHRRQRRKGKPVPYISHLISVSALVWEDGGDEDQAIAALLHDAIEDAGVSAEQIAARCGDRVASIVVDCTDTSGAVDPGGKKEPWLLRKTRTIASLEHKPVESLGESVQEILASAPYRACVTEGLAAAVWAAGYAERISAAVAPCLHKAPQWKQAKRVVCVSREKAGRWPGRQEAEPPELAQITETVVPLVPWNERAIAWASSAGIRRSFLTGLPRRPMGVVMHSWP